jgi:hypothetical protein
MGSSTRLKLSRQPSPKRCNEQLMLGMTALRAAEDDNLFLVSGFFLFVRKPFNHYYVTLFTNHGALPADNGSSRSLLSGPVYPP